ncbi:MAG: cyclophilin-like fold protein [Propionicimonas sp.]
MPTTPARPAVLLAALLTLVAGCGIPDSSSQTSPQTDTPTLATPSKTDTGRINDGSTPNHDTPEGNQMNLRITIGDQEITATLDESAAAGDLLAQLPVTVEMVDHGGVEKTGPLPSSLSLEGQPEGADPTVGDLGYYAPGQDLVLYYGDQSYYPGIVVLGRLDGDAAQRIAALAGSVTVTVKAR